MSDWSHGYDVSLGYSYGYYREMAPDWLDLCARVAGHAPPRRGAPGRFRYLDMGCGQGMGLCLLAAANPQAAFVGIDFQPDHIAHAQGLAEAAGLTNVAFHQADFIDLAADWPDDLGSFDYVVLHGVLSWVPAAVRDALIDGLRHATRPGSLIYASYNAQPGWLGTIPFQHVSRRLKETSGHDSEAVFAESIKLFDGLRAGNAAIFQILPGLKARLASVKTRSSHYLAHEYLHDSWTLFWHSEVAGQLGRAGLDPVGSATMAETMLPDLLPPPLRATILAQADPGLRQDVQDIVINQSFRRDIFRRGDGDAPGGDFDPGDSCLHLLSRPAADSAVTVETAFGELSLQYPAFGALLDAVGAENRPIAALAPPTSAGPPGVPDAVRIMLLLLHAQLLSVAAPKPGSPEAAHRLNATIARRAAEGAPYDHLAAPILGGAIPATEVELILLDAWLMAGEAGDAAALADGVTARLARLGRTPQHDRASLLASAAAFLDTTLARWRELGVLG